MQALIRSEQIEYILERVVDKQPNINLHSPDARKMIADEVTGFLLKDQNVITFAFDPDFDIFE